MRVTDMFCGCGGSSTGLVRAHPQIEIKIAANHWELALETHALNHPQTQHVKADISTSDPFSWARSEMLWASPECTFHSIARGERSRRRAQADLFGNVLVDEAAERSRATMWDVVRFAEVLGYDVIAVENVVDVRNWTLFPAWMKAMHDLGYHHKEVYLNSMFAWGNNDFLAAPQSRDRIYVIFWRKGIPEPDMEIRPPGYCPHCERNVECVQTWLNGNKSGKYRKPGSTGGQYIYTCATCRAEISPYYMAAANAIDWTLPIYTIGDRKDARKRKRYGLKQLSPNTVRRIKVGLEKFANVQYELAQIEGLPNISGPAPMIVMSMHGGGANRAYDSLGDAHPTVTTARGETALALPFIDEAYSQSKGASLVGPFGTQTTRRHHGLVFPFLVDTHKTTDRLNSTADGHPTVTTDGRQSLVVPGFLSSYYGGSDVNNLLFDAAGAVTTKDRHALVTPETAAWLVSYYTRVSGQRAAVSNVADACPTQPARRTHYLAMGKVTDDDVDACGYRGLTPREVARIQAFPDDYQIRGNDDQQVKQVGNAVSPPAATVIGERLFEALNR